MRSLFTSLFRIDEAFESIKDSSVKGDTINGLVSPYATKPSDDVAFALDSLNSDENEISNKISRLHQRSKYGIDLVSLKNINDFKEFLNRTTQALALNNIYNNDAVLQKKLAELLTYYYSLVNNNQGFYIYSEVQDAKNAANLIFNKAEKSGLNFLPVNIQDVVKTVLFLTLYKLPKKK